MADSIGFDPVPWSVDGGRIDSETMRLVGYISGQGSDGIVSPGDCRVHQLSTAGRQIVIDAGAVVIRNRSAGARNQSYIANGRTQTLLDVPANTGTTTRHHLVVVRVEDPEYPGWTQPSAAAAPNYQYTRPIIIQNVPSTTTRAEQLNLGYSAYALARIDMAPGSSVTDQMIKNLREMVNPHSHTDHYMSNFSAQAFTPVASLNFLDWNVYAPSVKVPIWATRVSMLTTIAGVLADVQNHDMQIRTLFNGRPGTPQIIDIDNAGLDPNLVDGTRETILVATELPVNANERGVNVQVKTQIQMQRGMLVARNGTQMVHSLTYYEDAV